MAFSGSKDCRERMAWLAALALALSPTVGWSEQLFYRYVDRQGVVVLDDHIPPEFVGAGYTVLMPDGRIVEVVPRPLTGELGRRQREAALETERRREWDESLLRRYSSSADIVAARDRAVRDYAARISILHSNLLSS